MRRRELLAGAAGVGLLGVTGCRRDNRKRIAVIPKATSHLFWIAVQSGVEGAGKDFNVDILWNGPPMETDYERQAQIVDSMVAQQVDGIAIAAAERVALVPPVDRAVSAGIPVTVFDSGLDSDNYLCFIATDNFKAGQMGGHKLAQLLDNKGKVALLMHAPGSLSTMDREAGFKDVIVKEYPEIKIVAEQFGMSDRARARAAAENILSANPDLDGIFCSSEPSSAGVSLALKSRGLGGRVKFVGFDSSDAMIEDMRAGVLNAIVVQDPFLMGYEAVKSLVDHIHGKEPPKRINLEARVLVLADLDKPDVKKLLNPSALGV